MDEGIAEPSVARFWPSGIHLLFGASKRLAKMFVAPPGRWSLGSYHDTHGTVRLVPAKSMDGASASLLWSMFSEAGLPSVMNLPFLSARTKICCELPDFCSNVAQGMR